MLQSRTTPRVLAGLAATGALCLCMLSVSRADIVVKGSDGAKAGELNAWCSHHIPAVFHPQTDVVVRQLDDSEMNAYLDGNQQGGNSNDRSSSDDNDNSDIDGVFENDPPRITLRLPETGSPDMFTFAHEYGHFVWFDLFSGQDRKEYAAIYKKQLASHHLVTRYAATNLEEGFAEAFSFYINEAPVLNHRDPASYAFLARWENQAENSDRLTNDN